MNQNVFLWMKMQLNAINDRVQSKCYIFKKVKVNSIIIRAGYISEMNQMSWVQISALQACLAQIS